MIKHLNKIVAGLVLLGLVGLISFCIVSQIKADEIANIKEGQASYWTNIKNGKGKCTVEDKFSYLENPDKAGIEIETVAHIYWVFMGSKIGYCLNMYHIENGKPTSNPLKRINLTIYFDGEKVREDIDKRSNLREVTASDIQFTNQDPRLIATATRRVGKSWQPRPSWEERNWKIVGKEKVDGSECYIIEAVIEGPNKVQIIDRRWIDPNRSYCVVKMESWCRIIDGSILRKEDEWLRSLGDILSSHTEIELQRYGDSFWGPAKSEMVSYGTDPQKKSFYISRKRTITYDKSCAYNVDISEKDLEKVFFANAANLQEAYGRSYTMEAVKCLCNLKQIGLALDRYAKDHNNKFPDDLKEIYTKGYIKNPEVFWCPADTDPKPTNITNSIPNNPDSSQISYTYYPGHFTDEPNAKQTVIMEDNSSEYHGGSKNMLFLDGHCEMRYGEIRK